MISRRQGACIVGGVTIRLDRGIRHGSPEPLRGECDVPKPRQSRRSRAPGYVADQLPRFHGDARRSPISPEARAVRVCVCRETTCPTSGLSDGRTGHIRKVCRNVLTRRGHCRSERSAAIRSNGTRQGIRGTPPLFRTVPQTQATSWENHATASRGASLIFGYLLDIHRAFLCGRTKAERHARLCFRFYGGTGPSHGKGSREPLR
jgi:hypothetical protein